MKIDILTIFPEMFKGPLTESLIGKARGKNIVQIQVTDIRSFSKDKHHSVDDRPFGGGPGMVMQLEPIYGALKAVGVKPGPGGKNAKKQGRKPLVIYLSPQGEVLNQKLVKSLASHSHIVLLCGHYEGIDERALEWVDKEVSIGDYVLTGGEIPAMALVDSVVRMLPGVVKEAGSIERDSHFYGILDYPHYTRPAVFNGVGVPQELVSGNHARVEKWRREQALVATCQKRPDLLKTAALSAEDKRFLKEYKKSHKINK